MATLGNTYTESVALMVGAGEQMPNQSGKIARGLRTIGLELAKTAKQTKVLKTGYEDTAISLYDQNGQMKSTYDILLELYPTWQKMSEAQKSNLGLTIAGKNQYEVFASTMNGFGQVIKANETGLNSSGSAIKENSKYMESLTAKLSLLKAQFNNLILGDGGLSSFIKMLVDAGTAILKFANSGLGKFIINFAILATSVKLVTVAFTAFSKSTLVAKIALDFMLASSLGLKDGIALLTTTMLSNPLFWGALAIGGIILIGKAIADATVTMDEATQSLSDNKNKLDESTSSLKDLESQLKETKDKMNEIESFKAPTLTDKSELESLQKQNDELERKILLEKETQRQSAKDTLSSAEQVMTTTVKSKYVAQTDEFGHKMVGGASVLPSEELQTAILDYSNLSSAMDELNEQQKSGAITLDEYKEQSQEVNESMENARSIALSMVQITSAVENAYKDLIDSGYTLTASQQAEYDSVVALDNQYYKMLDTTKETTSATESSTTATDSAKGSLDDLSTSLKDVSDLVSVLGSDSLSDIESAWKVAQDALNSYNNAQELNISQYEDLMSLSPEMLSTILDEDGNIKSLADSYYDLYDAKIDQMAVTQSLALVQKAIDMAKLGQDYAELVTNVDAYSSSLWGQVDALMAVAKTTEGMSSGSIDALDNQISTLKDWASQAKNNIRTNGTYTKAVEKSTSSTDANTDSLKKNVDALKEREESLQNQVDKYDKAISYIKDKIDDYTDSLQKQSDKETDAIQKKIDKIKEEKDAYESAIDSKIDKLKEQQSADDDYYQNLIDQMESENDQLDELKQRQELLDNLNKARQTKVKVYKEGQGFVYDTDQSSISDAEKKLKEFDEQQTYKRKLQRLKDLQTQSKNSYDAQIKDLENMKDSQSASYDKQIDNLENLKTTTADKYNAMIDKQKQWLAEFTKSVNAYDTEQNRLNALQLTGIDFEATGWQIKLGNLSSFTKDYKAKLGELGNAQAQLNQAQDALNKAQNTLNNSTTTFNTAQNQAATAQWHVLNTDTGKEYWTGADKEGGQQWIATAKRYKVKDSDKMALKYYNTGVASVPDNGVFVAGDKASGSQELVIGRSLNNGVAMSGSGSGVVNASSTKTLAGILNTLGNSSLSNALGMFGSVNSTSSSSNSTTINISGLSLPHVTDANGFLDGLKQFSLGMTQRGFSKI